MKIFSIIKKSRGSKDIRFCNFSIYSRTRKVVGSTGGGGVNMSNIFIKYFAFLYIALLQLQNHHHKDIMAH